MNRTYSTVLSSLVFSGAVLVMAPQAWSQAGTGSQKSDSPAKGSSSERGTSGSGSAMQSEKGSSAAGATKMSKEDIKQVQTALKNKGMDPGPEDGVMGPKTQQALREFQKSNNLPVTGRIDEKTASALGVDVGSGMSGSSGMGSSSSSGMGSSSSSTQGGAGAGSKSGSSQSSSGSPSGAKGGTAR